jgi:photosystem II stability/assembly factor-like uncharacterized protein
MNLSGVLKCACLAFSAAAAIPSLAQDTWVRQSPFPSDRSAKSVFALGPGRAFFVGENELMLETNDAGSTWTIRHLQDWGFDPYYAVHFTTSTTGVAVGNNVALRTTNGGATWTPVEFFAGSWYHLDFLDANTGFAGANGALAKTTDGGQNWTVRSAYPTCPVIFGMDFKDSNVGLVGGLLPGSSTEGIFRTTDGGQTWILKSSVAANDVVWMSPTRAIADQGTTIRQSVDAGETWHTIALGITSGLVSMARAGSGSLVLGVSGKGDVWRSEDGGFTWQQTFDGPGALPEVWEIHFADSLHGWIVGPGSFFYYSSDGGQTWTQKNNGTTTQIFDIQMLDADFGMAVGHNGYVYRTTNGGQFWEVQKLEVTGQIWGRDEDLYAIDIVDRDFAAAAGPGGTVFKTEDGGLTWTSIGYPNLYGFYWIYDVDFIDHQLGYVYGVNPDFDEQFLFRTRNGGQSWEWVNMGHIGGGMTAQFMDADYGWLTADNDFGWRTRDGGQTWTSFRMPEYFTGPEVAKVRFLDRNNGWVVGWFGYVAKTADGGETWTLVDIGTVEDNLFDVIPVSETEIWLCGREYTSFAGVVYHSTNGGASWSRQVVTDWFYYPYRMTALPGGKAWFAGYAGAIFQRQQTAQIVPPSAYVLQPGIRVSGGLPELLQSDNAYLLASPQYTIPRNMDPITLTLEATSPSANPAMIEFEVESRVTSDVVIDIELWDFSQSKWVKLHSGAAPLSDAKIGVVAPGSGSRWVEAGSRKLKARVLWRPAPQAARNWLDYLDQCIWKVTP